LECERGVRRNLREEAGVGISVGIERLGVFGRRRQVPTPHPTPHPGPLPVARLHFVPARSRRSCERRRKGRGGYVRWELPHGDLSENAHPFGRMIIEMPA